MASEPKSRSKFRLPNGERRPKQAPRGISALRAKDPSIPNPLAPYTWKKGECGNPNGRSKKVRVSEALVDELEQIDPTQNLTRASVLAKNLVDRAEKDSIELERVLRITEPELAGKISSAEGLSIQTDDISVVYSKLFKD